MSTTIRLTTCVLALFTLLLACDPDKDEDSDTYVTPDPPDPEPVVETFEVTADGVKRSGGALADGCGYDFAVDALPDGALDPEIASCTLVFVLTGELNARSVLVLDAPGEVSQELSLPTMASSTVTASDFVGTAGVDGKWKLDSDNRGDCVRISSVTLVMSGEYTVP
jgi:hypothetical protein